MDNESYILISGVAEQQVGISEVSAIQGQQQPLLGFRFTYRQVQMTTVHPSVNQTCKVSALCILASVASTYGRSGDSDNEGLKLRFSCKRKNLSYI